MKQQANTAQSSLVPSDIEALSRDEVRQRIASGVIWLGRRVNWSPTCLWDFIYRPSSIAYANLLYDLIYDAAVARTLLPEHVYRLRIMRESSDEHLKKLLIALGEANKRLNPEKTQASLSA